MLNGTLRERFPTCQRFFSELAFTLNDSIFFRRKKSVSEHMYYENINEDINVSQTKPDIELLKKKDYMIVDMHVHTRFSDSYSRVKKIIAKAKRLQIGVAITDHNEIKGVLRAYEIKGDVTVIPGIEIGTAEGPHILIYFAEIDALTDFYKRFVKSEKNEDPYTNTNIKINDLVHLSRRYDCLVSVAHPFSMAYTHVPRSIINGVTDPSFLDYVDAVEVLNGAISKPRNAKAIDFAMRLNMNYTGGSDSHSLFELGKIVTYAKADSIQEFFQCIRKKENYVVGTPVARVKRFPSVAKLSHKHMVHLVPLFRRQLEQFIDGSIRYQDTMIANKIKQFRSTRKNKIHRYY